MIGAANKIPPILSREEEDALVQLLGTSKYREARSILIERNFKLVSYIAKNFKRDDVDIEELINVGSSALQGAVLEFTSHNKDSLLTYAAKKIEKEILEYLKTHSKVKTGNSFCELFNIDWNDDELLRYGLLRAENDTVYHIIEEQVDSQLLLSSIEKLSILEEQIVNLRFINKKPPKEVAAKFEMSQSYLNLLEKKILKKLKNIIFNIS